jgi:hypothetical protein
MSIVTDSVARNILDSMININETRRNIDSSIDESRCIIYSQEMIQQSKAQFNYNVGRVSDGTLLRLVEDEIYFKIVVNISMIENNQEAGTYLYRACERSQNNHPSIMVSVDGLKIPDNEVLFYPTKSNVDIFVPIRYIKETNCEILVEKKTYKSFSYIRYYEKKTSGQVFSIPITENKYNHSKINERTTMIFINKKLYVGNRSVVVQNKNTITVSLFQEIYNSEIEIIIDSGITYFLIQNSMESGNIGVFEIPETYIDSIHGPVSKFSCYFYADGKRLLNDLVSQQGRLHFSYDFGKPSTSILSMYITDIGYIKDTSDTFYGSDYYLYNMTGVSALSNVFRNKPTNTIFDNNIDFYEVLSNNKTLYDRKKINEFLDGYYALSSSEERVKYLLPDRPYLMRKFLENYGKKLYTYTVDYNGNDPFVNIGLVSTFELDSTRKYDININTLHIASSDIEIINKNITDIFKIPSRFFLTGKNIVEINVFHEHAIEYYKVAPEEINSENGALIKRVPVFEQFISTDDIYILEKSTGNTELFYPTKSNSGYIHFNDASIHYDEDTKEIVVSFNRRPDNDILIYNSNFVTSYYYQKPFSSSSLDIMISIYTGTSLDPIPFIPKGKIELYAGTDKLIQGIDYFIKHPLNESKAAGSLIVVKRAMLPGTVFDIYFSNIKTKKIFEKSGYFKNNPYGLFYLGKLNFPFSLKYLDVHINNKRCTEADIDILSDKLIRIHSFEAPLFDLSIESTFTLEDEYLDPFINIYKEDNFEKYIETLFRGVYHNRPYDPEEVNSDYNEIYQSFISSVDSVNKEPNPLAREAEWIPSYNNDPAIVGISNDGSAMGGNDIYASLVAGDIYIVAGEGGRVASYNIVMGVWSNYDSGQKLTSDGTHFTGNITSIVFYKGIVIFSTDATEIGYYDIGSEQWGYPNCAGPLNIHLNFLPYDYFPGAIRKIIIINNDLIIAGDHGNVTTYSFDKNSWYSYNDYSRTDCLTISGIMDTIYDAYVYNYYFFNEYITALVVVGEHGQIASGYYHTNKWTKPNGEWYHPLYSGPLISHDGSSREYKDIYAVSRYLNYLVLFGSDGLVTLYDLETSVAYAVGDMRNISNTGRQNGFIDVYASLGYNESILIVGSDQGRISSYFGENEHWNEWNGSGIISNDGGMMDGNAVYALEYTFVGTHYIIFAGKNGKVCSYNVDAHELSFRFNPYKTAFLQWYITPGMAYVDSSWVLPQEVMELFTIYKESDDYDYDIELAGGDMDLTADIDMDDRGNYPHSLAERRKYIGDFILGLDEGNYTEDEVWDKYINSNHKYILYPWDVPSIASGDIIDDDVDIDLAKDIS